MTFVIRDVIIFLIFAPSFAFSLSVSDHRNLHDKSFSENVDLDNQYSDLCNPNPCQNDGQCFVASKGYRCICKVPFFGRNCEMDPCTERPCENDGTCVLSGYSFKCECKHPYRGDLCQEADLCSTDPCYNGGTCEMDGGWYKCKCRFPYSGLNCEKGICVEDRDCYNGGICRRRDSDYYCDCLPNFGGDWCERNILCDKLDSTCRAMGATCKVIGFNAICDCPYDKMYNPRSGICEDICDPWRCIYGKCEIMERTYKCNCDSGYTGHNCNERIKINPDRRNIWMFPVMTFFMSLICLLLIGVICQNCRNRKMR